MDMKVHYHGLYETNPQRGKGTRLGVVDGKVTTMDSFFLSSGFSWYWRGRSRRTIVALTGLIKRTDSERVVTEPHPTSKCDAVKGTAHAFSTRPQANGKTDAVLWSLSPHNIGGASQQNRVAEQNVITPMKNHQMAPYRSSTVIQVQRWQIDLKRCF